VEIVIKSLINQGFREFLANLFLLPTDRRNDIIIELAIHF